MEGAVKGSVILNFAEGGRLGFSSKRRGGRRAKVGEQKGGSSKGEHRVGQGTF